MSGDVSNWAAGPVVIGVRPATPVGLTVESVACSAFAKYNPGFPRKLHGRILPAHFFCLIALFAFRLCMSFVHFYLA